MTKGNPKWEQFEHEVQDILDLRSTPGSGNQWHAPSDGVSKTEDPYKLMVDCKFTEHANYSLNGRALQEWWNKATEFGYRFALPVRLQGALGGSGGVRNIDWVAITLDDYAELVDAIRILNGPKRCGSLPAAPTSPFERDIMKPEGFACCRKTGHFGHHDNGAIEWA